MRPGADRDVCNAYRRDGGGPAVASSWPEQAWTAARDQGARRRTACRSRNVRGNDPDARQRLIRHTICHRNDMKDGALSPPRPLHHYRTRHRHRYRKPQRRGAELANLRGPTPDHPQRVTRTESAIWVLFGPSAHALFVTVGHSRPGRGGKTGWPAGQRVPAGAGLRAAGRRACRCDSAGSGVQARRPAGLLRPTQQQHKSGSVRGPTRG
jgi:hypothetical protein